MSENIIKEASLGQKLAERIKYWYQFEGNTASHVHSDDFMWTIESLDLNYDNCKSIGVVYYENFQSLTYKFFIQSIEEGGCNVVLPCMFPRTVLERLPHYKPWATLVEYLNSRDILPFVVFLNEPEEINGELCYPTEIRIYPNVSVAL